MLIKILGTIDLLAILSLILVEYLPHGLIIIMAVYLMVKGIFFGLTGSFISLVDSLAGFYLVAASYGFYHWIISIILVIFLLQKAIISIFS